MSAQLPSGDVAAPLGPYTSAALAWYFRAPDHPCKLRVWGWLRRLQRHRRLLVRFMSEAWLTLDERSYLERRILLSGSYEPEVAETLLGACDADEVVWDVGANIGSFAARVKLDSRVASLVCFEPDRRNRAILTMNLALNGGASHQILPTALADVRGRMRLEEGPSANRGLSRLVDDDSSGSYEVACETVDHLVFETGLRPPTLIKIDVEGAEARVLRGAERLLTTAPPKAIVFEADALNGREVADPTIVAMLTRHGYVVTPIPRGGQSDNEKENFLAVKVQ